MEKVDQRKSCSARNVSNLAKSGGLKYANNFNFTYMPARLSSAITV